ncbi:MAG: LacI family DNA-binding transcriptional regulator [Clostridia bacterium]|nr:LacI family DNA-binding transcriptional regulator [Clostridia bacterium]
MAKAVRMADIAEKLGISVVSVSKGLTGKDGVSEELRARIQKTAEELGYRESRNTNPVWEGENVGILVPDRFFNENAFYYTLYRNLLEQCQKKNMTAMVEIIPKEAERACEMPSLVQSHKVDGVIFMGEVELSYIRAVAESGLPFLLLDFYKDDLECDSIRSDNVHGGYVLTRHLLETGRKNIGFVGSILETSSIMDRYLGCCKALLEAGIEPNQAWRLEDRDRDGVLVPLQLPEDLPEAFVCSCDEVAFRLVELLKAGGKRVPEDVAVTGYDDFRFATMTTPNLTSYTTNVKGLAEAAVTIMKRRLQKKTVDASVRILPGSMVIRASTQAEG